MLYFESHKVSELNATFSENISFFLYCRYVKLKVFQKKIKLCQITNKSSGFSESLT